MTVVHATPDELAADPWRCNPANPDALLFHASTMVTDATLTAVYTVDSDSHPTDPAVAAALRDATCVQAKLFADLGVDPNLAGLDTPAVKRSKGIGTGRVEYDTSFNSSVTAFAARRQALAELCPAAVRILGQAGLTGGSVRSYG